MIRSLHTMTDLLHLLLHVLIDALHLHWCIASTLMHYIYIDALHLHWCITSTLMHYIYIDALHLHWCTTSTLMHCIYIDALHLHWCITSTLMHCIYIDALHLHWCVTFTLMYYIYIDVLHLHWCITSTLMRYFYSPFPTGWDSKWSSEWKWKFSIFKVHVSFHMSRLKRDLRWPSRIFISLSTTISSVIFSGTGCTVNTTIDPLHLPRETPIAYTSGWWSWRRSRKTMIQWCVHCMQRFITFTISYLNWFVTFSKNTMIDSLHATIDSLHSPQHILMGLLHPLWIQWCMRSVYHIYTNGLQEQLTELETLAEDND